MEAPDALVLTAKCVNKIKNMYECFTGHVIFNGHVSD